MRSRVNVQLHPLKYSSGANCIKCRQCPSPFAAVKGKHILTADCGQLCWLGVAKTVEQVVWADCGIVAENFPRLLYTLLSLL